MNRSMVLYLCTTSKIFTHQIGVRCGYQRKKELLVTGGAQGMGRSFTLELAKSGANVMFCDLNAEKIAEVEAEGACITWWRQRNGSQRC